MQGQQRPPHSRGGGGASHGPSGPHPHRSHPYLPWQPPPLNQNPSFRLQNPNLYSQNLTNHWFQNLAFQQNLNNPFLMNQNPNFPIQNATLFPPCQFSNNLVHQQSQTLCPPNLKQEPSQNVPPLQNSKPEQSQKLLPQNPKLEPPKKLGLDQSQSLPPQYPVTNGSADQQPEKLTKKFKQEHVPSSSTRPELQNLRCQKSIQEEVLNSAAHHERQNSTVVPLSTKNKKKKKSKQNAEVVVKQPENLPAEEPKQKQEQEQKQEQVLNNAIQEQQQQNLPKLDSKVVPKQEEVINSSAQAQEQEQNLPPQKKKKAKKKAEGMPEGNDQAVEPKKEELPKCSAQLQQQKQHLPPQKWRKNKELLERIDQEVEKVWHDLLIAGENVSAWTVSQAVILALQVDSWDSLGCRMQEVPALHRLIVSEGKINAFIHCFVGVQRITTLYDLEVAICKNEGIELFEELKLGPLLQHPLVLHYFKVNSNSTEVFKITSEEIILALHEFMYTYNKKDINVDEFLDFVAKKKSATGKELLGIRIQSFGMHISFIQGTYSCEQETLKRCLKALERKSDSSCRKSYHFSSEKKNLQERFSAIRQRVESFSSVHKEFCGKHIRFVSSSSEDEESDNSTDEEKAISNDVGNWVGHSSYVAVSSERGTTCPYPSATEEMSRLGLKSEIGSKFSTVKARSGCKVNNRLFRRKRKLENISCTNSAPSKLLKGETGKRDLHVIENDDNPEEVATMNEDGISLSDNSMMMFITTWKESCKEHTVAEVLERMLQFYKPTDHRTAARQVEKMKSVFSSYPFIGLLNVAVNSLKRGMWDTIYDAFQAINERELTNALSESQSIDVNPVEMHTQHISEDITGRTVDEIIRKVTRYYELYPEFQNNDKSFLGNKFVSLKKLSNCELWVVSELGVKEFKSLGYGEFIHFLENHALLLPPELKKLLAAEVGEKSSLEVCMLQHQLIELVSQAANTLWENETITKQMISMLLTRQFPLICFNIMENDCMEDFLEIVGKHKKNAFSCVLFSATLLGRHYSENSLPLEAASVRANSNEKTVGFESVTSKDALALLLRAPMLSDLNSWLHWDLVFASSLGPLAGWLLTQVNVKELLCLVTKDGKVIRIDPSATADSFLEAALQGSSFETAVKLLSLYSLSGGEKHVPLSLLKCYASHAFTEILKNHFENMEVHDRRNNFLHGKAVDEVGSVDLEGELQEDLIKNNQALPVASRFFLDCLSCLPLEFRGFAADVLLYGMRSVVKNAPSAILGECNKIERLMLHEIGLSNGVMEWIDDYSAFCSSTTDYSSPTCAKVVGSESSTDSKYMENGQDKSPFVDWERNLSVLDATSRKECVYASDQIVEAVVPGGRIGNGWTEQLSDVNKDNDAALVVESIRRDEFGLDPNLSNLENIMLKKQHARLGRALHCLSQELYSQDSHFLLELVQNADDNIYPENVEPTLTFILEESGIVILNNEQGFSPQNVRALCDVGNSTKKGSSSGYIGHKGIGFKSVFRVTDAPEIHSNGFHIKFDISEGQIGFVLPTVVPPRDVKLFSGMLSRDTFQTDNKCWNTCIVLPFRSKLLGETAVRMFLDLHPSLLLFLHRLQCIMFRNMLNDSLIVMRKEILEDGMVKVSCGADKMTWLVASQKLQAHPSRHNVQTTEISIAFTLEEVTGEYNPRLDQQPVFAFLPLRTYGLKFILQGDFILPSSREEVDKNNPWNEWLLTKFPALFLSAEKLFCSLSCFRDNPGKAVASYMSFVPLIGEVHGFFSGLPKAIILELRRTCCLLLEGDNSKMVPPCNVLRGWDEQAHSLLPDHLLEEYLGLGFLDKNIVLSDSLAKALGVMDYGPEILIKFMAQLCSKENGLKSMAVDWLSSWLNALYIMLSHSSEQSDLLENLRHIQFIPLSDGAYSSVDAGPIWLHSDALSTGFGGTKGLEAFPKLYAKLRIVHPSLLSASAVDGTSVDNITRMLHRIGVQELSGHEIIKVHILPALSDVRISVRDKSLMTDYLCFVMIHLQSSCPSCRVESEFIISELQNKAYILTNHGYRRPVDTPIHFSKEFGNPIDINRLINVEDMRWHVVDVIYLKHPANESLSNGWMKWREFFLKIGITDFVQVIQIDKSVADLTHTIFKNKITETDLVSPELLAKDWKSHELENLLSILSASGDGQRCKYLLEVLDMLWEDNFSDKVAGHWNLKSSGDGRSFKSSFMSSICDVKWVVSSTDDKLHYPKDLFYDCDVVRSILSASAPYALPKVKSAKLLADIGFKTNVTVDDALQIFEVWRNSATTFKASVAQMSKLYMFIWDEMAASKNRISEALHSGPFIFVPYDPGSRHEDVVSGVVMCSKEVYWHDPTGSVDQMKQIYSNCCSTTINQHPLRKTLCNIYPGLHNFFVSECGVHEIPSHRSYLDILQQLSTVALPSQAANAVFNVFLKWADGLKSGSLSSEDIIHIKECLSKLEYAVLPTVQDKWVSLHPLFGLVCWCDDEELKKIFKNLDNIDFLYFGNLSDNEQEILQTKVSVLMQNLGIPALSEVVTREAIYDCPADSSAKASLISWALPYAQRYIYGVHPDRYSQLKNSGFKNLKQLQIVVVEKLLYKNVIRRCGRASKKHFECSCLLQGNALYTTSESDSHSLYLELSRMFFDGSPELHLANFLHMITTMAESGYTEQQTEFFIVNSQKVPQLPDEESIWCLSSIPSMTGSAGSLVTCVTSTALNEQSASNTKKKAGTSSNWPPNDWKTAPGFDYARAKGFKTQPAGSQPSSSQNMRDDNSEDIIIRTNSIIPIENGTDWTAEENPASAVPPDPEEVGDDSGHGCSQVPQRNSAVDPANLHLVSDASEPNLSGFSRRVKLNTSIFNGEQALLTGKMGERVAFKYFSKKLGKKAVKWINEGSETGLPYDIVIGKEESSREYIEVKTTKSERKDWFIISMREWQFAVEKGDSFSIAHVVLLSNNNARITTFRNPVKQCQQGNLQLVLMMPKQE